MKKKIIFSIITLILLTFIFAILTTTIRDFFDVYQMSISFISIDYFIKIISSKETYIHFFTRIDALNGSSLVILGVYLFFSIVDIFSGNVSEEGKYLHTDEYGSHGTSRWQKPKEIKTNYYNNDKKGWVLGHINRTEYKVDGNFAYHTVNNKDGLNMQINIVGAPGSEKTTSLLYPSLIHLPSIYKNDKEHADIIVTDPKGEIYRETANYYINLGYDVKVLDFIHFEHGDTINVLDYIESEKELMEIADGYVRSVEGESRGDKFWMEQEGQALSALIGASKQVKPKEKQTYIDALRILTDEMTGDDGAIDMEISKNYFTRNNIQGAALQLWKNFLMLSASDSTAGNILGGLAGKLKLFAISEVQAITSKTTIDITKLGDKKEKPMILYILMPDGDVTFSPIINNIITTLFIQLYKTADKYDSRLPNPVYFILEEIANIGYIPGLQNRLGTMRGRRIYPMMIWQSLSQMKNRYPNGWEDILSMCDTHMYLGVNDNFTAKYVSEELGNTTIKIQGTSKGKDGIYSGRVSENKNYQQRKLLFADEITNFDTKKSIITQRGRFPVVLSKVQYKYWEKRVCKTKKIDELPLIEKPIESFEDINVKQNIDGFNHQKENREHSKEENTIKKQQLDKLKKGLKKEIEIDK